MPRNNILFGHCVFLIGLSFAGCSGFGKPKSDPFLKPLVAGPDQTLVSGNQDERQLCLETAKSVAAKGHAVEAIKLYEKAESLGEHLETLDLELAALYAQIGRTDEAVIRYRRLIDRRTATPSTFNNLAWTLIESGRYGEATTAIEQGLSEFPENERLESAQAVVAYHLGDRQTALTQFASLYGQTSAHHNLAVLDLENGRLEQAMEHIERATQDPGCPSESIALRDSLRLAMAKQGSSEF